MTYTDPDFKTITVTVSSRARRIIMRAKADGLYVTMPEYATKADVLNAIGNYRAVLKERMLQEQNAPHVSAEDIGMLRCAAKSVIPGRVAELASLYGFTYQSVKIQSSRTRWGSCSARNSINISIFVMQLPPHLIDYVILHELCHTVYHDHSERFWMLMDKVCAGKARNLNKEMKNYHIN